MLIKRIAAILLIACVVMSCGAVYYAAPADVSGTDIALLADLGILKATMADKPDKALTRAEIAQLAGSITGTDISADINFSDLPSDHWAYKSVCALAAMGIMSGNDDGTFQPDEPINGEQLQTVAVKLLGYDILAKQKGGYPIGYGLVCAEIGLPSFTGETVTVADAAKMFAAAIDTEVLRNTQSGTRTEYDTEKGYTLGYKYLKLVKLSGIIKSNARTGIGGAAALKNGDMYIDDTIFHSQTDLGGYLGYAADVYVREIDDSYEFAAIRPQKGKNKVVTLYPGDIADYSAGKFTVNTENLRRSTTYEISNGASIVYNGKETFGYEDSDFKVQNGEVILIDNNRDEVYDVVLINSYYTDAVNSVGEDALYLKEGKAYKFDDYDSVLIADSEGDELSKYDILADDIASVGISKDNKMLTVTVSKVKAVGKLSGISIGDPTYVTVAGTEYEVLKNSPAYNSLSGYSAGIRVTAYCDYQGKIAVIKVNGDDTYLYGFLADAGMKSGMDGKLDLLLYDNDGVVRITSAADKTVIDGKKYNGEEVLVQLKRCQVLVDRCRTEKKIKGINTVVTDEDIADVQLDMLIRYKITADNEINWIDTAAPYQADEGSDDRLCFNLVSVGKYSRRASPFMGMFGTNVRYDGNTTFYDIPTDRDKREMFKVTKDRWHYSDNSRYVTEAYYTGDKLTAEAVCYFFDGTGDGIYDTYPLVLVTKVSLGYNSQEKTVVRIEGLTNSGKVNVTAYDEDVFKGVGVGDIIRYSTTQGEASHFETIYDYDKNKVNASGDYYGYPHIGHGFVYKKEDTAISLMPSLKPDPGADQNIYNAGAYSIVMFDRNTEKGSVVTASDIVDYKTAGDACSEVFVMQREGTPINMIIYNK